MIDPDVKAFFLKLGPIALEHIIPLTMLLAMFVLFYWVLRAASRGPGFDASEFLRDETNRLSFGRLAAFVCLSVHTWAFAVWVVRAKIEFNDVVLYCTVWSGSLILLRALDIYRGVKLGVVPTGLQTPPLAAPPDPAPSPQQP